MNTIVKNGKQFLPVILAVAGLVIVALALGWSAIFSADGAPPPNASCGKVQYLAYESGTKKGDFGPAVHVDTVDQAKKQMSHDFCTDPLLFATDKEFAEKGLALNSSTAISKAQYYAAHTDVWKTDLTDFMSTATNFRLVSDPHKYYSIGMVTSKNGDSSVMPKLVRGSEPVNIGAAVELDYNGVTREYRLECHFQGVVTKRFPNVPAKPTPPTTPPGHSTTPPGHSTTPPGHSTCTPPPYSGKPGYTTGCNAHKKHQSYNCQQNAGPGCPPNPAHQDPLTPRGNQGKVTQQPTIVPSHAPAPQSTQPVNMQNPSSSTPSGTNGGSTSNPIVSGPPVNGGGGSNTGTVAPPP